MGRLIGALLLSCTSACAQHTLLSPMAAPGLHSTPQGAVGGARGEHLTAPTSLDCPLAGRYLSETPDAGTLTLIIETRTGENRVSAEGNSEFDGHAEMRGKLLQVLFRTQGGNGGYYEWMLDEPCMQGEGKLVITAGGHGEHASKVKRLP